MTCIIATAEPLSEQRTQEILEQFYRNGFALIPGVLTPEEVTALRDKTDELFADPELAERTNPELADKKYIQVKEHEESGDLAPFILRNTLELDQIFRELLIREPIISLAEAVLGPDCKFCGQNVLRNQPGVAITRWHVDGAVHFPLPEGVVRHDPRIRMPVMWLTVQMALTDIESITEGPTQYVPGSHYAGRSPDDQDAPTFEGSGPTSILCQAGDIYLHDPQCWHRGAPNRSDRPRYLLQSQYAAHWAFWRFNLCNRVPVDEHALQNASDRLLRVLGRSRPNGGHG